MNSIDIANIKHIAEYHYYYKVDENVIERTKSAIKLYKLAVEMGDVQSLMILSECYLEIENLTKAEEMYLLAEKEGVPNALRDFCNQLSEICYRTLLPLYYDMYEKYLHKFIDIEPAETIFNLADFYHLKEEYDKFEEYFERAYALYKAGEAVDKDGNVFNDAIVINIGAEYYCKVVGDLVKAEELYIECCNAGRPDALFELAEFYHDVVKDYNKMFECYQKMIDTGDEVDLTYLKIGKYYWTTVGDKELAKKWWEKGAETSASCMYHLSLVYNSDNNVQKRLMCLFSAGRRGHAEANFELGEYYSGFPDYLDHAKKYYKRASKSFHLESMVKLAFLLEYSDEGIQWLIRAGDRGYQPARATLRVCCNDYNLLVKTFYRWGDMEQMIDTLAEFLTSSRAIDDDIIQIIMDLPENLEFVPNSVKLIHRLLHEKIDIMDLHFQYSVEGKGFKDAKDDFIKRITS